LIQTNPIGIFDSGIGGLTVAQAIRMQLPNERIIYFGDTAHLPYGDKSTEAIQSYAIKICNLLLDHDCKVIVIACNSASAAAYSLVKAYVGSRAKVVNVIDPTVDYVSQHYHTKKIGVIGTRKTIDSDVYAQKIAQKNPNIQVASLATPLLAPMIEEGYYNHNISHTVIAQYLSHHTLEAINSLILACTHYPLIKDEINAYYNTKVEVLDSASLVALEVKALLKNKDLLAKEKCESDIFYVSDYTTNFNDTTRLFFKKNINLKEFKLWE